MPEPWRPARRITVGGRPANASFELPAPMSWVSSSWTIFTTCWPGVRLFATSWPSARSLTWSTNCLTTFRLTSASSSASRISRIAREIASSSSFPLPRRSPRACCSRSPRASNIRGSVETCRSSRARRRRRGAASSPKTAKTTRSSVRGSWARASSTMIRAQSSSGKPPTPVPKAGSASERAPSSSARRRQLAVVRRTRAASVRRSWPMTAPWSTQRAGRRPAPVATALPSGIGPSATASRSISSPPARFSAPATPAPIHRWSFAAFATASTSSAAMSPSTTSSSTGASSQAGAERSGTVPGRRPARTWLLCRERDGSSTGGPRGVAPCEDPLATACRCAPGTGADAGRSPCARTSPRRARARSRPGRTDAGRRAPPPRRRASPAAPARGRSRPRSRPSPSRPASSAPRP